MHIAITFSMTNDYYINLDYHLNTLIGR